MNKYDNWLESPYNEAEDEQAEFDEQIAELLNGDYNPDLPENIKEAFLNDAFFGAHWDALVDAIQKNEKAVIGLIITTCLYEYWETRAEQDCQP
jgi:hypothetical protein